MLVGSVRWLGRLTPSELAVHMARAAIFALPAKYEPFGLSAVEAALAGCALVLGDIPSLREVWGDAAMFVSPYDDDRLIAAIQTLCRNRSLRSRLSASARTRALELNPTRMGDAYAALYARMSATVPEAACAS
jgi:glycosyltransferase involved in cell wall biosynthesis